MLWLRWQRKPPYENMLTAPGLYKCSHRMLCDPGLGIQALIQAEPEPAPERFRRFMILSLNFYQDV